MDTSSYKPKWQFNPSGFKVAPGNLWSGRPVWGRASSPRFSRATPGPARARSHASETGTGRLRRAIFFGAAASMIAAPAWAGSITACGSINAPGIYSVAQDLASSSGDCLDVSAPGVVLYLGGHAISGKGSGAGVHFTSRARNSFVEGGNAQITGFAIGLEDDAMNFHGDNFRSDGNTQGGVLVTSTANSTVSNFEASKNGQYGVRFSNASNSAAETANLQANGNYGAWLDGSKTTRVDNFDVEQNLSAGVYVGCSAGSPGSPCSKGSRVSSNNLIFNGFAVGNGPYGVAIDARASGNVVTAVESIDNATQDLMDGSSNCGSDSWFGNTYATATPQTCIR